tara:strand:+ start:1301 stop:2047 length:747 start_codon:yes stop_codon:yes gene_type:complete
MLEIEALYIVIFFLIITIQTIIGVGVLVLGTPIMLLLNHTLPEIIQILLPISILTSLINIFYFNVSNKKNKFKISKETIKFFFCLCIPSIFIGTIILKNFYEFINFKIFVSFIIFLSLLIKLFSKDNILVFSNFKKKIFLTTIGLIHGLTNSGGSLLSIFFLALNGNSKSETRYDTTFFYLFLAFFQFIIFMLFFEINFSIKLILNYIGIICIGVIFGNIIERKIGKKVFSLLVDLLALLAGIFLIIL